MPGPLPKDAAIRQRQNKTSTHAVLSIVGKRRRKIPKLPELGAGLEWNALTLAWWEDTWRSPMADEYLQADVHGLYILARLIDAFWTEPTQALAAEIRLQRQCFGLTPIDRSRLQWTIEKTEAVTAKKRVLVEPPPVEAADDPRQALRVLG